MPRQTNRAAWLVALLVVASALACSVEFSTAHFADAALYSDPEGATRDRAFNPGESIYLIATLTDAPPDAAVRAEWSLLTRDDRGAVRAATPVDQDERSGGEGRVVFEMTPPAAQTAWPRGDYRVELFIDGERRETLDFTIR